MKALLAAAGVNPPDNKLRFTPAYHPEKLPALLGCDGAGVADAIGSAVTRFKIGDEVYFCNGGIGDEPVNYAEYTTSHEGDCAAKPANLTMPEAAATGHQSAHADRGQQNDRQDRACDVMQNLQRIPIAALRMGGDVAAGHPPPSPLRGGTVLACGITCFAC